MKSVTFDARVISGSGRGKKIGVPTLNLEIPDNCSQMLAPALYTCMVTINADSLQMPALLHYGARPTFNDSVSCEIHVFDTIITNTVTSVTVTVLDKIREVQKFNNTAELLAQIDRDITIARTLF